MNADQLLDLYDRVAEAPDAIPRLRRFVLDLAVRGKLVEQDAADEPASELLKRIAKEKLRLVTAGEIANPKMFPVLAVGGLSFTLPLGWEWSQISNIGIISPRIRAADEAIASFVPMAMIAAEYGSTNGHEARPWGEIKKGYTTFGEGDVGLAKITPCFENGKSTVFRGLTGGFGAGTTELHVVRPIFVNPDYVVLFLKSPTFIENGIPRMTGTAGQKRVPTEYFAASPFPLPPFAEQHRIVAKVDELMALLDRLEQARAGREALRDQLTAATLNRLTQTDPEDFQPSAHFALQTLSHLTTRPDQIKTFRQTILNLAVRGKLVEQDAADTMVKLPASRKFSAPSEWDVEVFEEFSRAFSLPFGWQVAPMAQLSDHIVDCPHTTPKWTEKGEICVRTNQLRAGTLDLSMPRYVSVETYLERIERLEPEADDILYSREGGILGMACRIPAGVRLCLGQRLMLVRAGNSVRADFLELVLNSPFITEIARVKTTGGAAPRVNMSTVRAYPIPLPPLAEQHRIVARVEALMALCDQLEAGLTQAARTRTRLLDALLHAALHAAAPDAAA